MSRSSRLPPRLRPSLFQAGAPSRFVVAFLLVLLLWTAIFWATR